MDRFPRFVRWCLFVLVVGAAAVAGGLIGAAFLQNSQRIDKVQTALNALCAQRHDLDQRIEVTNGLLARHRGEKRIFGIPRSLIVVGLHRDLTTRANLNILDCKEP